MIRFEVTFADGDTVEITERSAIRAGFTARNTDPTRRTVLHVRPLAWAPPAPAASS